MDVCAENRGRPHQKVRFSAAWWWRDTFWPRGIQVYYSKGQECLREIRTEKFMFMLVFLPEKYHRHKSGGAPKERRRHHTEKRSSKTRKWTAINSRTFWRFKSKSVALPALQNCLGIWHWKRAGIFGEILVVSVFWETKHEKSSKNSGKKNRRKIRVKIRDENSKNSGNFRP